MSWCQQLAMVTAMMFGALGCGSHLTVPALPGVESPMHASDTELGRELRDSTIWAADPAAAEGWVVAGFRRDIELSEVPTSASVSLFAYTRYMLFVNGEYVGRGPNRFEPRRPEFDTWEIRRHLRQGRNTVCVQVRRDWPEGGGKLARMMAHPPGFSALIRIAEKGGKTSRIVTDQKWHAFHDLSHLAPRGRTYASIPETIDGRREIVGWREVGFDPSVLPLAVTVDTSDSTLWPVLAARTIPMLRETPLPFVVEAPVAADAGGYRLAAGQELKVRLDRIAQAYPVLEIDAPAGSRLITASEFKTTGASTYVTRDGRQTWLASDTAAVRVLTVRVAEGSALIRPLAMVEVLYPFDLAGRFECSDPLLNQVWAVTAKSALLFSEDAYVDCADRERSEWMDCDPPIFDATRVMMVGPGAGGEPKWSDARLMKNLLLRVGLSQTDSGMTKARTCSDRIDVHTFMEDRACDWVSGIRKYHEATHDDAFLRLIWPFVNRQLQWFLDRRTPSGLVRAREWIAWDNPLRYGTCQGTANNAFIFRALADGAYLAEKIGLHDDSRRLNADAERLQESINTVLWNEALGCYHAGQGTPTLAEMDLRMRRSIDLKVENDLIEPTLHANLFALDQGVVPTYRRARVIEYVMRHRAQIKEIMAQHCFFKLLYSLDEERSDQMVLQRIRDGWRGMAESPDQTTWEKTSGGSKSHVYGIVPGYTLSTFVLGVRRDAPVWERTLVIDPRLGDLRFARGVVVSEFGPVPVSWTKATTNDEQVDRLEFSVDVPAGVLATIRLAGGVDGSLRFSRGGCAATTVSGRSLEAVLPAGQHVGSVLVISSARKEATQW